MDFPAGLDRLPKKRNMKKLLYLPIETIVREFDARVLLTYLAVNRGYFVIIGEKGNVRKAAETLDSGIYFHKSHSSKYFPCSKDHNKNNFVFVSLDEEGLVFIDDSVYIRDSKPFDLKHLDIIFTWGSYQRNLLIKVNPELESRTIAIGNPRFDLLRKEFKPLYKKAYERLLKKWDKYILINTRFVSGNFSRLYGCNYLDFRINQFKLLFERLPSDREKDFFVKEEIYYKEIFKQYTRMLKGLSSRFPNLNFILRPHPSEDILNWKEALKNLDNVFVEFDGSVVDWILGAVAVIHSGCTTGIEAWALNKPVIVYNPNDEEGLEPQLPNEFGIKIKDTQSLFYILDDIADGRNDDEKRKKQLQIAKPFIESIDGEYSAIRFLDNIDSFCNINSYKMENLTERDYLKLSKIENMNKVLKIKILKFLSKNQSSINRIMGKKISDSIYGLFKKHIGLFAQFKKFPELRIKQITNRMYSYDKIFNKSYHGEYLIKKIASDTYLIYK
jgi:surface carbohydrate biosynthesis protein